MTSRGEGIDNLLMGLRTRTSAKWRAYEPDVLPMWVAEMDFPLAEPVQHALRQAIDRSDTGYRWAGDLPDVLAGFFERRLDWTVEPSRVMVLGDVLSAIAETIRAFTAPEDAVVITPPVYPPFFSVTRDITRRALLEVPLLSTGELDLDGLAAAFALPQVRAFVLCNPHNPTGVIPSLEVLRGVAELARAHDVVVISDEIWTPLALGGRRCTPYLSLGEDLTGPDVALVSASKAFNLAGLKCAQIVAGSDATADFLRQAIPMEITYGAGHLGVIAAVAAYRDGDEWLDDTLATIASNAALLRVLLATEVPAARYRMPEATYLAWIDCADLGLGDDPAAVFLERGGLALNAGAPFGAPRHVRMNLATSPDLVAEGVERMRQSLPA